MHEVRRSKKWVTITMVAACCLPTATVWAQSGPKHKPGPNEKTQIHPDSHQPDAVLHDKPALDGYCPAAYLLKGKALKGNPRFKSVYAGETYYLSSKEAKLAFDRDPEKYLPKLGGWCLMALGGPYGNRIIADPAVFEVIDGDVYLFSSQRAKNFYDSTPGGVLEKAHKLFGRAKLFGYCPVSYLTEHKAVLGKKKFLVAYKHDAYQMASAEARKKFIADPTAYVPPYEGYCAISLLDKHVYWANPTIFSIYNGKVYFFLDSDNKQRFDRDPEAIIKRADPIWKKVQAKKIVRKGPDPNG